MAKILSFLSWNVENFHNDAALVDDVVDKIVEKDPDVFGIYEVKGAAVFSSITTKMPNYSFSITESPGIPEILVGFRNGLSCFVTQKDELQSKVPSLRPGALAAITINGTTYSLLFLHLKSFPEPRDWGLRDDMFKHVTSLKRAIDNVAGGNANFVALGDMNTMGMKAAYNDESDMTGLDELAFVNNRLTNFRNEMRILPKTHDQTWWNGSDDWQPSNLDHVFAADHMTFRDFNGAEVEVSGWVDEATDADKRAWIDRFSDHSMLYGEIHD